MSELESYTEVTTESWGSRLRDSLKGIIFGILLFLGGTALLWWNEGRTVSVGDAINEAERVVEELPAVASVDPAFDNKLVHAFGRAETKAGVKDPDFPGIEVKGIALRHSVEFYQMVEHKKTEKHKNAGGSETTVTTYTYSNEWVSHPVTQSFAKRPNNNMVLLDVKGSTTYAQDATLGAYGLDSRLVRDIGGEKALDCGFTDEKLQRLQNALPLHVKSGRLLWNTGPNALYIGADPNHARIGDVRVKFYYVPESEISILALASGGVFKTWRASNNQDFFRVELGKQEVPQMIQGARDDNAMMCWIFRALGCILVIAGLRMILAPISVVLDVIPLLGNIGEMGISLVAGLIGFAWSLIVVAIAWVRFRPVLGAILLAAAAALIAVVIIRGRRKKAQVPGQPMAPGMPGQPMQPLPGQPGGQAQSFPGQQGQPYAPQQPAPSMKEKLGGALQQLSNLAQQGQQGQQGQQTQNLYGQPQAPYGQAPQGPYGQPQAPYGQAPQGPYGQQGQYPGPQGSGQGPQGQ